MDRLPIPIERGSLRRRESETSTIVPTAIGNANPRDTVSLSPSTTCLCQDPFVNTASIRNTRPSDANKPYHPPKLSPLIKHIHHKNIPFYSVHNLCIYKKKFKSIHTQYTNSCHENAKTLIDYNLYLRTLLTSHMQFDKLIILDWDDTLFPTHDIPRQQLRAFDCNPLFEGETKQLYYNIKSLIDIIISLFDTITAQHGQIKIVTNAGYGWLSGIFNGYFSGVIGRLFERLAHKIRTNHVEIVSARDEYVHRHGGNKRLFDGEIAKRECLENLFRKYKQNVMPNKVPIVYCIGDGFDEFNASKHAWDTVIGDGHISILQRIKFMQKPSIGLLMEELKTVEGLIKDDTNAQFVEWILNEKFLIDYV